VLRPGEETPVHASHQVEQAELARYVAAIEDDARPAADFQWLEPGAARIRATLRRDDLVSVQVGWFAGWKAAANGRGATRNGRWAGAHTDPARVRRRLRHYVNLDRPARSEGLRMDCGGWRFC